MPSTYNNNKNKYDDDVDNANEKKITHTETEKTDGATIESISDNMLVNPGEEAKLSCTVKGNMFDNIPFH